MPREPDVSIPVVRDGDLVVLRFDHPSGHQDTLVRIGKAVYDDSRGVAGSGHLPFYVLDHRSSR